jgi:similar to spore coat protein
MEQKNVTQREIMEIHELLILKILCGTKSLTMKNLVQDDELKNILHDDYMSTKDKLNELKQFINFPLVMEEKSE